VHERPPAGQGGCGHYRCTRAQHAVQNKVPNVENIGAASLMSIPWSGGGSLVVWRHTHGYPDRLEAAYKLIEFMTRKQTMMDLANNCYTLPSRTDALDELFPPDHTCALSCSS
jgi:ABC-type glycerol-3-phosphate transport system substrate-binding protein